MIYMPKYVLEGLLVLAIIGALNWFIEWILSMPSPEYPDDWYNGHDEDDEDADNY